MDGVEKKMKKILTLLLALVMILSVLTGCSMSGEAGRVYYLNFKPEADQAWQALAASYTEQTGVEVTVVTVTSGTYTDALTVEMAKDEPVTLFNCGNAQDLADWADHTLDLTDTAIAGELTTTDYNLYDSSGALKAIGYCCESFGIIVNKALLAKAGYDLDDITNFDTLKAIAEDIHARAEELGFDAFAAPGLDRTSSWRFSGHLANMPLYYEFSKNGVTEQPAAITGEYLNAYRNIWDLYIRNSSADAAELTAVTGDESAAQFKEGRAVFYQNGSWEFAGLVEAGIDAGDLAMIPIYCGVDGEENAGLCFGTENCWAVNAQAGEADIQATLDFIYWVVTSDEGTQLLADQFGAVPFQSAKTTENVFCTDAAEMAADGKYIVNWVFNYTPNADAWRAGVVDALAAYSAGTAGWSSVKEAFVDGWAREYSAQKD